MSKSDFIRIAGKFGVALAETCAKLHGVKLAQRQLWALTLQGVQK